MQIQNLNVCKKLDKIFMCGKLTEQTVVNPTAFQKCNHLSDDEYFSHMVLDDLNLIIRDIREAHKKDSESAGHLRRGDTVQ